MIYVKEDYKLIDVVGGSGTMSQRRIVMEEYELLSIPESLHLLKPVSQALAFHLLGPGIISGGRHPTIHSSLKATNHK